MKKKLDLNQLAKSIVEQAISETSPKNEPVKKKNAQNKGRCEDTIKSKNQLPSIKSNS